MATISIYLSVELLQSNRSRPRAIGNGDEKPGTSSGTEGNFYVRFVRQ